MRSLFATVAASTLSANQRRDCSNLLQCWQTVVARTHPLKRLTFCGGVGGRAERKKLLRFRVGGNTPRSEMGTLAPSGSGPTAVTQLESLSEDRQSVSPSFESSPALLQSCFTDGQEAKADLSHCRTPARAQGDWRWYDAQGKIQRCYLLGNAAHEEILPRIPTTQPSLDGHRVTWPDHQRHPEGGPSSRS